MKKKLSTILLCAALVVGVGLLAYPSVSDYWNQFHQSRAIASYAEQVADMSALDAEAMWAQAQAYNAALIQRPNRLVMSEEEEAEYRSVLDVSGTGIMGYIDIPQIQCTLPIYHGSDESVLQIAVGHIEGTSLPVGGESTHCVLSGHRALPSARLFTDLDKLAEGDTFMLRTLDETLTYQVDEIHTVLPHEVDRLEIEPGKDLCTLVTCTPYGVNSHRLLVRGVRIDNLESSSQVRVTADAVQVKPVMVVPVLAAPVLLLLLLAMFVSDSVKRKERRMKDNEKKK